MPLFVQFDRESSLDVSKVLQALSPPSADIQSSFVEISIVLFADDIPGLLGSHLRALLPIYLDSFFSLPVTRADGTKLGYEDVVRTLDAETLSHSIHCGNPLQEGISLKIKVLKEKYPVAIAWLRDLLWGSTLDWKSVV